jgi:copper chaperone CopZ
MKQRSIWVSSLVGAVLASACCLGPLLLGVIGMGSLGVAAALAPYRPWFLLLTLVLLGLGFFLAYCPIRGARCGPAGECIEPPNRTGQRAVLWTVTLLTVVLASYPSWGARIGRRAASEATMPAGSNVVVLEVSGMTCTACESEIARELQHEPGVRSVRVSFNEGRAWVALDPAVLGEGLMAAVHRAGYTARVASQR